MSYRELTAADFVDKTPDEIADMVKKNESGLKSKNDELLGKLEKQDELKSSAEESKRIAEEARKAAVEAEEAKLLAEGKYQEAQELREKERANLVAQANAEAEKAREMLRQRDLQEVHSDIMRGVHENFTPAAQALLAANTEVTYGENGEKKVTIRHGDKEFNSTADFKEFAKTDPTWSAMLSAPNTKGVGATNTTGSQAPAGTNYSDMTLEQKADYLEKNPLQRIG